MSERREARTERDATLNQTLEGHRLVVVEYIKISREPQQQQKTREGNNGFPLLACGMLGIFGGTRHQQASLAVSRFHLPYDWTSPHVQSLT